MHNFGVRISRVEFRLTIGTAGRSCGLHRYRISAAPISRKRYPRCVKRRLGCKASPAKRCLGDQGTHDFCARIGVAATDSAGRWAEMVFRKAGKTGHPRSLAVIRKARTPTNFPDVLVGAGGGWTLEAAGIEAESAAIGPAGRSGGGLWPNSRTGCRPAQPGQLEVQIRRALPGNWLFPELLESQFPRNAFHPRMTALRTCFLRVSRKPTRWLSLHAQRLRLGASRLRQIAPALSPVLRRRRKLRLRSFWRA